MELVKVFKHVNQCYSNEDGQVIHREIINKLSDGKNVTVSFDNVDGVTSSFVNSALIELLEDYTFDFIKTKIKFTNTSKQINDIINQRFKFEVNKRRNLVKI